MSESKQQQQIPLHVDKVTKASCKTFMEISSSYGQQSTEVALYCSSNWFHLFLCVFFSSLFEMEIIQQSNAAFASSTSSPAAERVRC